MATVGRVWAHTDAKSANLPSPASPGQGEEQCMSQASPVPNLGGVTCQLRAQQHRGPLSAATSPLGTPHPWHSHRMAEKGGCQAQAAGPRGSAPPLATWGTGSPTPGPPQLGGPQRKGSPPPPSWGTLPVDERKSCSPLPQAALHPVSNTQVGQSHGWVSPVLQGPTMPSPLDSRPGLPWGMDSPAQRGLPRLAPCPGRCLSVRLGREDE